MRYFIQIKNKPKNKGGRMKHYKGIILKIILTTFILFYPTWLLAGPLESTMTAYLVVKDKNGKETLKKTETAAPGEMIEYVLSYHNTGKTSLSKLVVNGPIPPNTAFVQGSNATKTPHEFEVSIDHGNTWEHEPVKRKQKNKEGKDVLVIIPPTEYTNVQWKAQEEIGPGQTQSFRYRIIID